MGIATVSTMPKSPSIVHDGKYVRIVGWRIAHPSYNRGMFGFDRYAVSDINTYPNMPLIMRTV
jgi:hypothetical protein